MQITINVDEALLNEAFQLTDLARQEELINLALQEFVRSRRQKNLLNLTGQIQFAPDFDYKALRETRHAADWHLRFWMTKFKQFNHKMLKSVSSCGILIIQPEALWRAMKHTTTAEPEMNPESIVYIERRLGYIFRDKSVLIRALTRKAFAQEHKQQGKSCEDQEIYRILGDAVLKAILVEMLIKDGYNSREAITNRKIELEKRESLGTKLREMQISQFIRFGMGEKKQNIAIQSSVLGETFEALIAAIHIDGGSYETTKKIVIELFKDQAPNTLSKDQFKVSESSAVSELSMYYDSCDMCFQTEVCNTMRMCYFDITGQDW